MRHLTATEIAEAQRLHAWSPANDRTNLRILLRLRIARWVASTGHPIGINSNGNPSGTRFKLPEAAQQGWNYHTRAVADLARSVHVGDLYERGAVLTHERLWADALSSQPLAFNLFGPLALDLQAATQWARRIWPLQVHEVVSIRFEHSPGRGDPDFLHNLSAFDVAIHAATPSGRSLLIGIELKYHEAPTAVRPRFKPRYEAVAASSGCFYVPKRDPFWNGRLAQLWLDHLLAIATVQHPRTPYDEGMSVLLYPAERVDLLDSVRRYQGLVRPDAPVPWRALTLQAAIAALPDPTHRTAMSSRYLGAA